MLKVWEVDGEDLIVASSERDMRAVYLDYHGESIRGHDRKLVAPEHELQLTDDGDETQVVLARDFATLRGYYAAR